jgi:hypothetical protein
MFSCRIASSIGVGLHARRATGIGTAAFIRKWRRAGEVLFLRKVSLLHELREWPRLRPEACERIDSFTDAVVAVEKRRRS